MVGTQTMVSFGHFLLPDLDPKPKHAETLRPLRRIEKMIQFPLLRSPKKVLTLTWKRTEAIRRRYGGNAWGVRRTGALVLGFQFLKPQPRHLGSF
ncbi:hypothetical protein ES288_A05G434000v1 [Gossypium darwinii]|uniref:Uncharacterized protein n=1 Tax=Gossypium darwinii TaxID=34276 RepID=A0A5D2GRD0_GOSDA|nr:hypothetical protein ES288_A05G434000v1 [Gossypium darwinii]